MKRSMNFMKRAEEIRKHYKHLSKKEQIRVISELCAQAEWDRDAWVLRLHEPKRKRVIR